MKRYFVFVVLLLLALAFFLLTEERADKDVGFDQAPETSLVDKGLPEDKAVHHEDMDEGGNKPEDVRSGSQKRKLVLRGRVVKTDGTPVPSYNFMALVAFDFVDQNIQDIIRTMGLYNREAYRVFPVITDKDGKFSMEYSWRIKEGQIDTFFVASTSWRSADRYIKEENFALSESENIIELDLVCLDPATLVVVIEPAEALLDINRDKMACFPNVFVYSDSREPINREYLQEIRRERRNANRKRKLSFRNSPELSVPSMQDLIVNVSVPEFVSTEVTVQPLYSGEKRTVVVRLKKGTEWLSGVCTDEFGRPLEGVSLSLYHKDGSSFMTKSGDDGLFRFDGISSSGITQLNALKYKKNRDDVVEIREIIKSPKHRSHIQIVMAVSKRREVMIIRFAGPDGEVMVGEKLNDIHIVAEDGSDVSWDFEKRGAGILLKGNDRTIKFSHPSYKPVLIAERDLKDGMVVRFQEALDVLKVRIVDEDGFPVSRCRVVYTYDSRRNSSIIESDKNGVVSLGFDPDEPFEELLAQVRQLGMQ